MKYYVFILNLSLDSYEGFVREMDDPEMVRALLDLYPPPIYSHTVVYGKRVEL